MSTQATDPSPIDLDVIETLRQLDKPGERSFLAEMVEIFFEDSPPRLEALERAVRDSDPESLLDVAHALKGSCSNFGAHELESLCLDLELTGRSAELAEARAQLSALRAEYTRVHAALSLYL